VDRAVLAEIELETIYHYGL